MKVRTPIARNSIAIAASLAMFQMGAAWAQSAQNPLNLEEVVVTGTATGASKMKQSVSISTLSTETLQYSAPSSSAEVLRAIPGIRAESTGGEGNANINVRGLPSPDGGARYAQFQEDGLPVLLFGDIMFGTADTLVRTDNNLDRLEVIRGGSASTFTSNAPGAILNFISKTGDEKGGSIGITKGVNFNRTRYDVDYGMPISDATRFHIGGYYRSGEGIRTAGAGAEQGGQLKANITHQLDKGSYVRLNFKTLDDQVPMYLPMPMQRSGTNFTAFPGLDPLTGFTMPKGLIDVSTNANGQRIVTDTSTGAKTKSTSFGAEVSFNLDGGWNLNDKFRTSSTSGSFAGMTSPNVVGTADALALQYGGAGSTAVFHSNGKSAAGQTAFVGHLFNVTVNDLGNTVNDLKLTKSFGSAATGKIDSTFGLFNMSQNINMDWHWDSYLLSMSGTNPQVIDIMNSGARVGASTNNFTTGFTNGAAAWGNCCVTAYSLKYNQTAPYAAVAYEQGPINADASLRIDRLQASGAAPFGNQTVNYSLTKPAYSFGGNYRINTDLSSFARISHGTRFNADRVANGNGVSPVTGGVANANSLFDTVDQYELGFKTRQGDLSLFGTAFLAKTRITSYDPTKTPPELAARYSAKGIELEAGYRMGAFRVNGGLTYTNSKISDGSNAGNAPQRQAKTVYQITPSYVAGSFVVGGSFIGTGSSFSSDGNTFTMPGYIITNAFVSYAIDKRATVSVSVNNLFNKMGITEIQDIATNYFSPRTTTGRAVQASLKYAF